MADIQKKINREDIKEEIVQKVSLLERSYAIIIFCLYVCRQVLNTIIYISKIICMILWRAVSEFFCLINYSVCFLNLDNYLFKYHIFSDRSNR